MLSQPSHTQRLQLFSTMQTVVKSFGTVEGFRKTDLEHDRTFLFEHWSGAPFVWVPYDTGTHLLALVATDTRRRRIILSALETIANNFGCAIFFVVRGPQLALQPFSRDVLRDEVIAQLDLQSDSGATHGAFQP